MQHAHVYAQTMFFQERELGASISVNHQHHRGHNQNSSTLSLRILVVDRTACVDVGGEKATKIRRVDGDSRVPSLSTNWPRRPQLPLLSQYGLERKPVRRLQLSH